MDFQRTPHDFVAGETPGAAVFDALPGGIEGAKEDASGTSGISTSETTLTSRDVSVLSSRTHLIVAQFNFESTVASDRFRFRIKDGSTVLLYRDAIFRTAGSYETVTMIGVTTLSSGSHTLTVTAERTSGTGTGTNTSASTSPTFLACIDLGPSS